MAEAIRQIKKYASKGKQAFERNELIRIWVVYHLQILGEAARGISDESQKRYHQIPWSKIIGFRNILVHHYFTINADEIWAVIEVNIPQLKRELDRILKKYQKDTKKDHSEI
ncbi:MAG: DUF86 domain-containing protein [Methanoregula sp.]|nr:DUF86 domain-containing protein [Methanoregula sp.]